MWAAFIHSEDFPNLGHAAMDEEHARIAQLMNELHAAIQTNRPPGEQRYLLHQLEVYLRINNRGEEEMMEQDEFPSREAHRRTHQGLYRKLHEFERTLIAADAAASLAELRLIRNILLQHVAEEDLRIASWHRVHTISPDSPD